MPARLLSFLSTVEKYLAQLNEDSTVSVSRQVNYQKGLARMRLLDNSGAILLQSFSLADGQTCLRATLTTAFSEQKRVIDVYPDSEKFDWTGAARKVAMAWYQDLQNPAAEQENTNDIDALEAVAG